MKQLWLLLLCMGFPTVGQSETLSLAQCVEFALHQNTTIQTAQDNVTTGQLQVRENRATIYFPTLSFSSSARYSQNQDETTSEFEQEIPVGDTTRIQTFKETRQTDGNRFGADASLTLSYPLYNGGANRALFSQAKADRRLAEVRYTLAEQNLIYTVKQRYFDLLRAQRLAQVRAEQVDQNERYLDRAQTQFELGSVTQGDVFKAKVGLANAQMDFISAQNAVRIAKANLAHTIGLPLSHDFEVIDIVESQPLEVDLEQVTQIALAQRPELSENEALIERSETGVALARSNHWSRPRINLNSSYFYNQSESFVLGTNQESTSWGWSIGASANLTLFDGGATRAAVQQAKINHRIAERDYEQKKRDIALEVQEAYLNLIEARERIRVSTEAVRSAEEDLRLAEEKYDLGAGTFIEVTDAQVAVTDAKRSQVNAIYDYELAKAALEKAMGTIDSP
ncbi:MAG: TolC family protein [Gemmatimonadetes bacterium]|nr:MAG: TolC family protein [Gemmatimonadota bacterium]